MIYLGAGSRALQRERAHNYNSLSHIQDEQLLRGCPLVFTCVHRQVHTCLNTYVLPLCQHKRLLDSAHLRLLATGAWFLRDSLERSIYSQHLPVPQPIMPLISPLPKMLVSKTNWGCGVGGTETKGLQMGVMASISHWPYIAWQLPFTQGFRHFSVIYTGLSR